MMVTAGVSPQRSRGDDAKTAGNGKSDEYNKGWAYGTQLASGYVSLIRKNKEAGPVYASNVENITAELRSAMADLENQRQGVKGIERDEHFMGVYEGFVSVAKPYLR